MTWFPRLLGVATAVYSAAVIAKPAVLAKPCGLTSPDGSVPRETGVLATSVGARDLVSGLALTLAPAGRALRLALVVRVAMDLSDTVVLGRAAPDQATRGKIVGVTLGWAALNGLALLAARDRR